MLAVDVASFPCKLQHLTQISQMRVFSARRGAETSSSGDDGCGFSLGTFAQERRLVFNAVCALQDSKALASVE